MERAVWHPGWFDFDQSIGVGLTAEFAFWRIVPERLRGLERLVFYNDGWYSPENVVLAHGTITAIQHSDLGEIREVDTNGSNYRIYLGDGTIFDMDQEDEGHVVDAWAYDTSGAAHPRPRPSVDPRHFQLVVTFESLSDLNVADTQRLREFIARPPTQRRMTLAELSQRHGVALADAMDAAESLGVGTSAAESLAPEDVALMEKMLGRDRS